ncbi:MAG TPA: hypothetical protein DCZ91_25675 [Lachnospiraceae bacterium]|nr:hypothetical protein [Lachnospiraceae bacterium]
MTPVIRPETINILCNTQGNSSNANSVPFAVPKPTQTRWEKFKSRFSEICAAIKPVVEIFTAVVGTVATFLSAYGQCRAYVNRGRRFALV